MIDLVHEVIVTPRYAFPRLPDLRVIERPGWLQIVTPSLRNGMLNEVIYSALDETDADPIIDEAIAIYRDLGIKFRWSTAPGSAPADLGARLLRRGLAESRGRGMARALEPVDVEGDVVVVDAERLDDYTRVMAAGWDLDPTPLGALHRYLLADGRQRLFLAYCDGVPAATAAYQPFERSAFLMGGVVLPQFRGRGLYRALVHARLAHARSLGIGLATTHARESTSAPILEKLG
ncbi:MAG: GNAT family N-acetyltransferase, partial [Kofleriaceae bacterium]